MVTITTTTTITTRIIDSRTFSSNFTTFRDFSSTPDYSTTTKPFKDFIS